MRRMLTVLAVGLLMLACGQTEDDAVRIEGPTRDAEKGVDVYIVHSPFLGEPGRVEVLVPDKVEAGRTYRTLYVLPVAGQLDSVYGDGLAEVRKTDAHNKHDLIVVSMSFDSVPWYGEHASDPKIRHARYIKEVVVPLVEKRYPVSEQAADRLLLGFSKSGWGAVSMLLREPKFWGAACSWDAPLMMDETQLKWGSAKHFGTPEAARPYVPVHLVKDKAEPFKDGEARLTILGSNIFGKHTLQFHALLEAHDIPHHYSNEVKFKHHWASGWVPAALAVFLGEAER